jgi:hypothetical protein
MNVRWLLLVMFRDVPEWVAGYTVMAVSANTPTGPPSE